MRSPTRRSPGKVVAIDATSTVTSNVVTYNVTVALDSASPQVKEGMTATVDVTVAEKDGVLVLPASAITGRGQTADRHGAAPRTVTSNGRSRSACRGDDSVEIVSGVSEGDVVVTKVVTNTGGGATTGAQLGRGGRVGAGGGAVRRGSAHERHEAGHRGPQPDQDLLDGCGRGAGAAWSVARRGAW